jgi:hypothetical protein
MFVFRVFTSQNIVTFVLRVSEEYSVSIFKGTEFYSGGFYSAWQEVICLFYTSSFFKDSGQIETESCRS